MFILYIHFLKFCSSRVEDLKSTGIRVLVTFETGLLVYIYRFVGFMEEL